MWNCETCVTVITQDASPQSQGAEIISNRKSKNLSLLGGLRYSVCHILSQQGGWFTGNEVGVVAVFSSLAYWYNPAVPWAWTGPVWWRPATLSAPSPAHTWRQTVFQASPPSHHTSTCFPEHALGYTSSQSNRCSLCRWKWPLTPPHPTFTIMKTHKLSDIMVIEALERTECWVGFEWEEGSPSPAGLWSRTTSCFESPK